MKRKTLKKDASSTATSRRVQRVVRRPHHDHPKYDRISKLLRRWIAADRKCLDLADPKTIDSKWEAASDRRAKIAMQIGREIGVA